MAQQKRQALPDVHAITTVSAVVDGGESTPDKPAESDPGRQPYRDLLTTLGRKAGCSEICRAIDLLNSLSSVVADNHRAARCRQPLELKPVKQVIDALIENFVCEPNTLFWALAANRRMYYLSRRSVGCVVWALALGRRMGFERTALRELMLGAALLDIGKVNVPVVILAKGSRLNESEQNFARRHVADGVRMLQSVDGLSGEVIEMVRLHHERFDGSGYPFGLKGDEIPLNAQLAGIIDSFDALSLRRYYAEGLSGHAALGTLLDQRGKQFDSVLVDQFVSAIGEFPTGTWIEFSDGCTGVVCSQDATDPGSPEVVLIADANQQPFLAVRCLSLREHHDARVLPPADRPHRAAAMERSLQAAVYARGPRKY
jgi:HD-GYP domain-containing protein (c-di-GMP phosphodiesterase class II)